MRMLQIKTIAAAAVVAAGLTASPAAAAITTYTDLAAFSSAAGPITLFDFNSTPDGSFDGTSYDVGPFTLTGDATGEFSDLQVISGQVNANVCACFPTFGYSLTFHSPVTAFGADFSNAFGDSGITFTVDGFSFPGPVTNNGFFGFISTSPFTIISVSGENEIHNFDNVRTASAAIPEPATWAMLIAGFGMVGLAMRRRARTAAA